MISAGKIAALITIAACTTLSGCAVETIDTDAAQAEHPARAESAMATAGSERALGAARVQCLPGYVYVAAVNACVAYPYTIDRTPGAFGCPHGGIRSAHGRVFCLPVPHGFGPT